jgi:hypothetical protein
MVCKDKYLPLQRRKRPNEERGKKGRSDQTEDLSLIKTVQITGFGVNFDGGEWHTNFQLSHPLLPLHPVHQLHKDLINPP